MVLHQTYFPLFRKICTKHRCKHWRFVYLVAYTTKCTFYMYIVRHDLVTYSECKQYHHHWMGPSASHMNAMEKRSVRGCFYRFFRIVYIVEWMFLHCNYYWVLFKCGCMSERHDVSMESHLKAMFTQNTLFFSNWMAYKQQQQSEIRLTVFFGK